MNQTNDATKPDSAVRLTCEQLRWRCDQTLLSFETTEQVDPATSILGQPAAQDALMFGLQCDAPGQNIYVRGARGTGRLTMVRRLLDRLQPTTEAKRDFCYVHNFKRPDHPRLIVLAPATAPAFRKKVLELAYFVENDLGKALDSEPFLSERTTVKDRVEQEIRDATGPLEKDLAANNMALVSMQQGPLAQTVIFPLVEGKPVPPDQFRSLVQQGTVSPEELEKFEEAHPKFQTQLQQLGRTVGEAYRTGADQIRKLKEQAARSLTERIARPISESFPGHGVAAFIDELIDDVVEASSARHDDDENVDLEELYDVNIVLTHSDKQARPVVIESTPSLINLLGTVEPKIGPHNMATSNFSGIRGGAILNANQGYLILDVNDLISEPGAWRALMRTLRTGKLEIVPPELGWMQSHVVIQPEAIDIQVRVILIGDATVYYQLDYADPDFRELFKVLADFDDLLDRDEQSVQQYAAVVSGLAHAEALLPFHRSAIAALVEHGARIAARQGKLTARFGRIADIAREAAFLAKNSPDSQHITDEHVYEAVRRTKQRASLPSRKFQELVERGTIIVSTAGKTVGQINGLAVMRSGPLTYGFPARITATIGAGRAGIINIEGASQMSGAIHTKGFHILGGLLRHLLQTSHPLAFSASLAFEQSYGGIDGDSASGAEMVCLLSALTDVPIKQSLAMTGAIDQLGNIEAIGGLNEKIEGFFDSCNFFGLTGEQGVVIPQANAGDLMMRRDIVSACKEGKFHVYAVETIYQALEIMTDVPAGTFGDDGYAAGTLLAAAVDRAGEFWKRTMSSPERLTTVVETQQPVTRVVKTGDKA
jgi:ATP-dependent Lon protease